MYATVPRKPRLSPDKLNMVRASAQAGTPIRAIARNLGVSRGVVERALSAKAPKRTRRAAEFTGSAVLLPQRHRSPVSSWSIETIRLARDAQMRGDFAQAVRLAEILRTDDALFTAYLNRLAPQTAIACELKSCGGARGDAVAKRAANGVIAPRDVIAGIHGTLVNHGIAIGYLKHEPSDDGSRVSFRLTEWPLEHVKWNPSLERLETFAKDGGERVAITHGDGHWIVFRKFHDRPWIQDACLLPSAMVWGAHAQGLADWAGSSKSHGLNKLIGELPEGVSLLADEAGTFTAEATAFLAMLQDLVSGEVGAGIRPAGSKTDIVSNNATNYQVFSELILDRKKAAAAIYLGTDATLGAAGGAPGVDISALFGVATTKIQGDLETIQEAMNTGAYQPWTAINEGDSRYAPSLAYLMPDADAKAKAEEQATKRERFHAELKRYKESGMVVDQEVVNKLAKEFDVEPPTLASVAAQQTSLILAPTDVARVTRGREARASQGLPPFGDERDDMTIPEIEEAAKAKAGAAQANAEAQAQAKVAETKAVSAAGFSVRDTAILVGLSQATVRKILESAGAP
jgi:transposase-like protein